jgi:hypothetical protein
VGLSSTPDGQGTRVLQLLESLGELGVLRLPTLTTDELAALRALDASPLRDAEALEWWSGLAEDVRAAVQASTLRGLIARALLGATPVHATEDHVDLPTSPELAVLLAARRHPSFLAVCMDVDGRGNPIMRLYGAADDVQGLRCVLVERAGGGLHQFEVWSPSRSSELLAAWACTAPSRDAEEAIKTLEFILLGAEGPVRERLSVLTTSERSLLSEVDAHGQLGTPRPTTAATLATRLRLTMHSSR